MSYGNILTTGGKIASQYLPTSFAAIGPEVIPPTSGAITTISLPFNCPATGNYFIQLYMEFLGTGANVGTTPSGYTYTSSDGWGNNSVTPASLAGSIDGFEFVYTTIGRINVGIQTFTFNPGTGLNMGTGTLAMRVVGPVVG